MTLVVLLGSALTFSAFTAGSADAAEPAVGLGTAADFAVLAGSTVTNTGPSVLEGFDLGVSPGSAVTGFPPGLVTAPGVPHVADSIALQAQNDATTAFNDAAGRPVAAADSGKTDLVGQTLQPGVYQGDALSLTGTVTLDNNDVPDAVFIFQASSTLILSSSSVVKFTNAGHPSCNVFWEVGSSATIGTGSSFVGTLLARISVSAGTGATIQGRLLAKVGAVTLDDNTITRLPCGPTTGVTRSTAPAPTSTVVAVKPPVITTPPPRDVTSGSTASIIRPTTPTTTSRVAGTSTSSRSSTTPDTSTVNTRTTQTSGSNGSSAGRTTTSLETYTSQSTDTSGVATALATTGPPPIAGLMIAAFVAMLAGGVFLAFARTRRARTGRHHRPAH